MFVTASLLQPVLFFYSVQLTMTKHRQKSLRSQSGPLICFWGRLSNCISFCILCLFLGSGGSLREKSWSKTGDQSTNSLNRSGSKVESASTHAVRSFQRSVSESFSAAFHRSHTLSKQSSLMMERNVELREQLLPEHDLTESSDM